jgi:uncharacterized surface protein with fasciclin (FAS1) repeats
MHQENPHMRKLVALLALAGATVAAGAVPSSAAPATIADIVVAVSSTAGPDGNPADYDLLLAALEATNLTPAVADPSADLTVFAPNDAAFVALARDLGYSGTDEAGSLTFLVGALGLPNIEATLLYHVSAGEKSAKEIIRSQSVDVLNGTIQVQGVNLRDAATSLQDPQLRVPRAIDAGNGIIHPIDRVLVPLAV